MVYIICTLSLDDKIYKYRIQDIAKLAEISTHSAKEYLKILIKSKEKIINNMKEIRSINELC